MPRRVLVPVLFMFLTLVVYPLYKVYSKAPFDHYVLALSWHPAFCANHSEMPECEKEKNKNKRFKGLSLHGLWPSMKNDPDHTFAYCGVPKKIVEKDKDRKWCSMPMLNLSREVRKGMSKQMPGSKSCLHRHEWYKHGSCTDLSPDSYFSLSEKFVDEIGKSRLNRYLVKMSGKTVEKTDLKKEIAEQFGEQALNYISFQCEKNKENWIFSEIRIYLSKESDNGTIKFPKGNVDREENCPEKFKLLSAHS